MSLYVPARIPNCSTINCRCGSSPTARFQIRSTSFHASVAVTKTAWTWLTQKQLAELFQKDVRTVSEHIRNIFKEGELKEDAVILNFRITASDGKNYDTSHYNLGQLRFDTSVKIS